MLQLGPLVDIQRRRRVIVMGPLNRDPPTQQRLPDPDLSGHHSDRAACVDHQMRRIVPAAEGMAAMQAINQSAVRPLFMTALFGTALGCLGLIDGEMSTRDQPTFGWLVAGAGLFLVGAIVVTIGRNVPMNDSLAALGPTDPDAADHWKCYLASWAMWNHVRTIASLAAAGLLTTALVRS